MDARLKKRDKEYKRQKFLLEKVLKLVNDKAPSLLRQLHESLDVDNSSVENMYVLPILISSMYYRNQLLYVLSVSSVIFLFYARWGGGGGVFCERGFLGAFIRCFWYKHALHGMVGTHDFSATPSFAPVLL